MLPRISSYLQFLPNEQQIPSIDSLTIEQRQIPTIQPQVQNADRNSDKCSHIHRVSQFDTARATDMDELR